MMSHWQGGLYAAAVLIPLAAFAIQILGGRRLGPGRRHAIVATAAIGLSLLLSLVGLGSALGAGAFSSPHDADGHHPAAAPFAWRASVDWVRLGEGLTGTSAAGGAATPLPALVLPLALHIDGLAALLFVMVTGIATLVHVYSLAYMADDPHLGRFFAYLSLFCFAMLALLAAANLFLVFVCWELVGLCSYLLIGFWSEQKPNTDAANKAFLVNRVGDVGMLIGLGLIWSSFGTFTIADLNAGLADPALRDPARLHRITRAAAGDVVTVRLPGPEAALGSDTAALPDPTRTIPYPVLIVAGLGIFAGCVGKSAQFPLHVWLPDAMAGPTPVSALIHAATMVAAGVYLVARVFPLFTHEVLLTIAYTGGITLLLGATIAVVQTDYKKVLAYSTVSQLGFMMLGLGVGGWAAGLFHLITHAVFKALLFLGAGSVYHGVHTYELPVLGGLRRKMPVTAATMLVGTLAIAGVPLFSGFYSKDAVLAAALHFSRVFPAHWPLFVAPTVGAVLTAFYMFRMWFLIFDGEPRSAGAGHQATVAVTGGHFDVTSPDAGPAPQLHSHHGSPVDHAHESPPAMTRPLIILAVLAVVVGWPWTILPFGTPVLEGLLEAVEPLPAADVASARWVALGASLLIAAVGVALAVGYYSRWRLLNPAVVARRLGPLHRLFARKWYVDEAYDRLFVRPTLALASLAGGTDRWLVDPIVNGAARMTRGLSVVGGAIDRVLVDGVVNLIALGIGALGDWGRRLQTGLIRNYLGMLATALVALFAGVLYWIR